MKKVLIVDDEENFCTLIKKNLESTKQFLVGVCCDPTKAVEEAKIFQPDLILLDILMPEMSGSDVATELSSNQETRHVPIVFLTAIITEDETAKSEHLIGGKFFVAKPIETNELVGIIKKVIG